MEFNLYWADGELTEKTFNSIEEAKHFYREALEKASMKLIRMELADTEEEITLE